MGKKVLLIIVNILLYMYTMREGCHKKWQQYLSDPDRKRRRASQNCSVQPRRKAVKVEFFSLVNSYTVVCPGQGMLPLFCYERFKSMD